mgnify:FL=1
MLQRTLKRPMTTIGVGLHSGVRVHLTLLPAKENSGIQFCRSDLKAPQNRVIHLCPDLINDTRLSSTIVTEDNVRIGTIEHLMSALFALGIDNILIELDGPEIPIMDGSSLSFIHIIKEAGIREQKEEKVFFKLIKPIKIGEKDKWVSLTLYNGLKLQLTIDFNHPVFNRSSQEFIIDFKNASYIDEIARARTFGFMQEMELMRVHNLGLGGNLSNAIVIDDNSILNPEGLRYEDEFVRHKALDAIGDLYVLGHPLVASFKGYKSGHAINNALLRALKEGVHYEKVRYLQDKGLPDSFHYV